MDRALWTTPLSLISMPCWPCPICGLGHTKLLSDSLNYDETVLSKNSAGDESWDPGWIDYTFTASAVCSEAKCGQTFAISGNGGVNGYIDYDTGEEEWSAIFLPRHCYPMPNIFTIPKNCPDVIEKQIKSSFSLFFLDRSAAASRLRISLELLMDHAGLPRQGMDKQQKPYDLTLHRRLQFIEEKNPKLGAHLMALKWLGNSASHSADTIRLNELLDAYEVFEHALSEIIDKKSERLDKLSKKLSDRFKR